MSPQPVVDHVRVLGVVASAVRALTAPLLDVQQLLQELTDSSAAAIGADDAGLLLRRPDDTATMLAATSPEAGVAEMLQVRTGDGPCISAYKTGETTVVGTVAEATERWPDWSAVRDSNRYESVLAAPFSIGGRQLGTLNALSYAQHAFSREAAGALTRIGEMIAVVMVVDQRLHDADSLAEQLQIALDSRVLIEQAKGVLSERRGISLDDAFRELRSRSRNEHRSLREICDEVLGDRLPTG
jgi:transcriptional regulator with GAF, ATPase, and Fis domain